MEDDKLETPQENQEELSMEDDIRNTLRELREEGKVVESEEKLDDETPQEVEPTATKERDEKGKFTKTEVTPVAVIEPIKEDVEALTPVSPLPKGVSEKWATLDPAVQAHFNKREEDFHRGIDQYREKAAQADRFNQSFQPYMATINQLGVSPEAAAQHLFNADHQLRYGNPQQKVDMALKIFNDYGIDPNQIFDRLQNGAPPVDANLSAMMQKIQSLEERNKTIEQMERQRGEQAVHTQLDAFKADPKHPHFDTVKPHMAALLQAGLAENLEEAYDQAVTANPITRELVLAQRQQAGKDEAVKKAQAAKSVASLNVRSRATLPTFDESASIEDTVRAAYRKLSAA